MSFRIFIVKRSKAACKHLQANMSSDPGRTKASRNHAFCDNPFFFNGRPANCCTYCRKEWGNKYRVPENTAWKAKGKAGYGRLGAKTKGICAMPIKLHLILFQSHWSLKSSCCPFDGISTHKTTYINIYQCSAVLRHVENDEYCFSCLFHFFFSGRGPANSFKSFITNNFMYCKPWEKHV